MDLKAILQFWEVNLLILEKHFKYIFLHAENRTLVTEEQDFREGWI